MSFFTDPLNYEFFRQGLIVATLVGALCGGMGVFIVLRRMSYIGHGLSHAAFGGAVVAYLMNISFFIGAGGGGGPSMYARQASRAFARTRGESALTLPHTA